MSIALVSQRAHSAERYPRTIEGLLTRRASLLKLIGFFAAALAAAAWRPGARAGAAAGAVRCVLTPEQTEGPYYIEDTKLRRDVTEGRPGVPLSLRLTVVDASTCRPIKGATVEIWHCDAGGVYSGFGQGAGNRTFLRGAQRTDAKGLATLKTIYPGWYQGRTVHIHVKVHVGGNAVHTGQLYFPEAITDAVYKRAPYSSRPDRSTRNTADGIYGSGGRRSTLGLRKSGAGYVGTLTMGVRRS